MFDWIGVFSDVETITCNIPNCPLVHLRGHLEISASASRHRHRYWYRDRDRHSNLKMSFTQYKLVPHSNFVRKYLVKISCRKFTELSNRAILQNPCRKLLCWSLFLIKLQEQNLDLQLN